MMVIVWCEAFPVDQPLVRVRRQESLLGELIEGIGEGIGEALVGGNRRPNGGNINYIIFFDSSRKKYFY